MRITILGAGRMGGNLAKQWIQSGHSIYMGVRNLESQTVTSLMRELPASVTFGPMTESVTFGDILVFAVPYHAVDHLLSKLPDPGQKIVVDCTNPVQWQDGPIYMPGHNTAEVLQRMWLDAKVVKAFNTIAASQILHPVISGEPIDMFYCGNDSEAGDVVGRLAQDMGFHPVDCGLLKNAPLLENLSILLMVQSSTVYRGHSLSMKLRYE